MRKAIIVTSVPSMISQFNMDNIRILQSLGFEVSVATNFHLTGTLDTTRLFDLIETLNEMNVKTYQIDFNRGIGTVKSNVKSYKKLKSIFLKEKFDIIHCHSPIGGVLGRLAAKGTTARVIYTAHGFQFFKGGPLKDWILFLPIEKYLSRNTNDIITINRDDYSVAKNFNNKTKIHLIPGVGIDFKAYQEIIPDKDLIKLRQDLGIPDCSKIIISIGELSKLKNHITTIRAINCIDEEIYYLICGVGPEKEILEKEAKKFGIEDKVIFLGYVTRKEPYLQISDLSVFLSKREGLGLAGLEAMASGLPLVSSEIGGIKDYTKDGETGYTQKKPTDYIATKKAIEKIFSMNKSELSKMCLNNKRISSFYSKDNVNKMMREIYK